MGAPEERSIQVMLEDGTPWPNGQVVDLATVVLPKTTLPLLLNFTPRSVGVALAWVEDGDLIGMANIIDPSISPRG